MKIFPSKFIILFQDLPTNNSLATTSPSFTWLRRVRFQSQSIQAVSQYTVISMFNYETTSYRRYPLRRSPWRGHWATLWHKSKKGLRRTPRGISIGRWISPHPQAPLHLCFLFHLIQWNKKPVAKRRDPLNG